MNYLSGNEVRKKFLDFFVSKGHVIEPGVSLVPKNDPTLLWINAGVSGQSMVSTIREAVQGLSGQGGDIVIPVYLGGTLLDEVIVNAQQSMNLRSGGR